MRPAVSDTTYIKEEVTMNKERWQKLVDELQKEGLTGIALMPGPNLFYMTGLRMGLSERPTMCVVEASGKATFLMPKLERSKGEKYSAYLLDRGVEIEFAVDSFSDEEGPIEAFKRVFQDKQGKWALEYTAARMLEYSLMKDAMGDFPFVDGVQVMKHLRIQKDEAEIESLQKACALCDLGVDIARRLLVPGKAATEVVPEVEKELKRKGGEAVFMALATGPDTAVPHAGTTNTPVAEGDPVWLDLCVQVEGYWGDVTRSWAIGKLSDEMRKVYEVVREAQDHCRKNAKPGMTGAEVDALARDVIASYGYGDQFLHRTGHGLGLEVHEEPYIVAYNHVPLEVGTTFTIEPGIYIPGKGGVRIEDDVVLVPGGCKSLTVYPRNLIDDDPKLVV